MTQIEYRHLIQAVTILRAGKMHFNALVVFFKLFFRTYERMNFQEFFYHKMSIMTVISWEAFGQYVYNKVTVLFQYMCTKSILI